MKFQLIAAVLLASAYAAPIHEPCETDAVAPAATDASLVARAPHHKGNAAAAGGAAGGAAGAGAAAPAAGAKKGKKGGNAAGAAGAAPSAAAGAAGTGAGAGATGAGAGAGAAAPSAGAGAAGAAPSATGGSGAGATGAGAGATGAGAGATGAGAGGAGAGAAGAGPGTPATGTGAGPLGDGTGNTASSPPVPGPSPSESNAQAAKNWMTNTGIVSNFLNIAPTLKGQQFTAAAFKALTAEKDELNHKAVLDKNVNTLTQSVTQANNTLATQGNFQMVVDLLQEMVNKGDSTAVTDTNAINQVRCTKVLPNIDTYLKAAGTNLASVKPTGCAAVNGLTN